MSYCARCVIFLCINQITGQVGALFIVGIGEYAVVWLGTDWEKEIEKGIQRNEYAAQKRAMLSASESN